MEDMTLIFSEETFVVFLDSATADSVVFRRRSAGESHSWFEMKDDSYVIVQSAEIIEKLNEMYWRHNSSLIA